MTNRTLSLKGIFFLSICLFAQIATASNKLSVEDQISQYINSQQQDQISFLEKLVNLNSGTSNIDGVRKTGELLRTQLEELGFRVRWAEEPENMQRAGTLIAEHPGIAGKRLLLIGHLDTVFPKESSFQHFNRKGNLATGPGVIDDKGGDVVILYALKALESANVLNDADITIVLTGDEEDSGKPTSISRKPLIEAAKKREVALDFESAVTLDTASVARRGISQWMIKAEGNTAHSSEIFKDKPGFGAIYEIARILDTMRTQLAGEQFLTFNPGLILGGTTISFAKNHSQESVFGKENVIAKIAIAKGDLRFLSKEQKINAEKKIFEIVGAHLPGATASITFQDGIPAMPPTAANLELLNKYSQASNQLGFGEIKQLDPGKRGAGDISHIASLVPASLIGLGPVGSGDHSEVETINIDSLPIQTKRAALLIYWLTHNDTKSDVKKTDEKVSS